MPKVGFFTVDSLHQAQSLNEFKAALSPEIWTDVAYTHAASTVVATVPAGLAFGRNVFGPGHSPAMVESATATHGTRRVVSAVLNNARFSAFSLTVLDANTRVFSDGIENVHPPARLASFDGNFELGDDASLEVAGHFMRDELYVDCVAMPICSHGFPNYGHFLFDGLPTILLHRQLFPQANLRIIGQALQDWQGEILEVLGLRELYLEVSGPTIFRKLLTSTLLSMHVPYPTRFVRPLFDFARFAIAVPAQAPSRRIFFSRGDMRSERNLRNLDEIEALMQQLGFEIIRPEGLSFREQVALMAQASFVVAETGAALANIGFCDPGTKVLEIQADRFVDGWVRSMCFMFAHRWHVYFARLDDGGPEAKHRFTYAIEPASLERAIRAIDVGAPA